MPFFGLPLYSEAVLATFAVLLLITILTGSIKTLVLRRRLQDVYAQIEAQASRPTSSGTSWVTIGLANDVQFGIRALEAGQLGGITQACQIPRQSSVMRQRHMTTGSEISKPTPALTVANKTGLRNARLEVRKRRSGQRTLLSVDLTEFTHLHNLVAVPVPPPFRWALKKKTSSILAQPPTLLTSRPSIMSSSPIFSLPRRIFQQAIRKQRLRGQLPIRRATFDQHLAARTMASLPGFGSTDSLGVRKRRVLSTPIFLGNFSFEVFGTSGGEASGESWQTESDSYGLSSGQAWKSNASNSSEFFPYPETQLTSFDSDVLAPQTRTVKLSGSCGLVRKSTLAELYEDYATSFANCTLIQPATVIASTSTLPSIFARNSLFTGPIDSTNPTSLAEATSCAASVNTASRPDVGRFSV